MNSLDELRSFLTETMSMRDNYQPVIIKYLLEHNGCATKRQLAVALLKHDISKIKYYERILMRWPKTTLEKHGIFTYDPSTKKFLLTFSVPSAPYEKIAEILQICNTKIEEWEKLKGSSMSQSARYETLANANHKCQLCGVPSSLRPLDVDHIVPQSKQDKNGHVLKNGQLIPVDDPANLQVLCSACNRGKRDTDSRDFRPKTEKLVRDNIMDEITRSGRTPLIEILSDDEKYETALQAKLVEELVELQNAPDNSLKLEELADLFEILRSYASLKGVDEKAFLAIVEKKRALKGGFTQRIYLKSINETQ